MLPLALLVLAYTHDCEPLLLQFICKAKRGREQRAESEGAKKHGFSFMHREELGELFVDSRRSNASLSFSGNGFGK